MTTPTKKPSRNIDFAPRRSRFNVSSHAESNTKIAHMDNSGKTNKESSSKAKAKRLILAPLGLFIATLKTVLVLTGRGVRGAYRFSMKLWHGKGKFWLPRLATLTGVFLIGLILYQGFAPAKAANDEIVPNADYGTMGWLATNNDDATCTSGTHCPEVAEGSTHTTTGYISTGDVDDTGEVDEFEMTSLSNVDSVSQVIVRIYAQSATNALGGTLDNVDIDLYIGGSYEGAVTVTPAYNTWAVHSATFNGTWSQSDIDGARVQLTRTREGSGGPKGQDDDIRVASVYADVEYTQTTVYNQSSYRWFNNSDASTFSAWSQTIGGTGSEVGELVIEDSAGNYIVTGSSNSYSSADTDIFLTKFNSSGVEQWSKTWGGVGVDQGQSVIEDSSGNYIVTGYTKSYGGTDDDVVLIKFNSSGVEQWSKTWGDTSNDVGNSVIEDSSGNFIVAGYSNSYGGTYAAIALIKFNSSGVEQWSKTWGGIGIDQGQSVIEDSSGDYIVTGYSYSYGSITADIVLIKFNSSGVEQWSKTWGGTLSDYGNSVIEDSSGNYIVVGRTASYGGTDNDIALIKFNSSGVEQWSKTWGGTLSDIGNSVIEDSSGNYIVTGSSQSYGGSDFDIVFNKYDSNGDIASCTMCATQTVTEADQTVTEADQTVTESNESVTEADQTVTEADESVQTLVHAGSISSFFHTLGGTGSDILNDIIEDSSGNFIGVGTTASYGGTDEDIALIKFNSSGVEQWSKTWGGSNGDVGRSVIEDSSGNFIVTGSTASYGGTDEDIALIKFNRSGVEQWSKTWGGSNGDVGRSVIEDSSGNFIVTGYSASYGGNDADIALIKFNSSGVEQWSKTWGANNTDDGYSVIEDSSGNYIVTGNSASYHTGAQDTVLIKFNSSGVEQWSKTLGLTFNDYQSASEVIEDSSGNFIVAGNRYDSNDNVDSGLLLMKFNSAGVEQWTKHWEFTNGDSGLQSVFEDSNGNFVVTGATITANSDIFMTKFNSAGVEQWSKVWGGASDDIGHSVIEDSSGNYIIAGRSISYGAGSSDMVLLKTASDSADCGGVCSLQDANETFETLTEVNETVTEANETVTEANETVTEADETVTEAVINEVYKAPRIDVGTAIAAEDTAGTAPAEGTAFRLRLLQHVSIADRAQSTGSYKLQYAEKSGTCDTSFTGETYADVGATGIIRYYDNTNGYNGQFLTENANDPTHSTDDTYPQTYAEANNFTNSFSAVSVDGDAMWDFALVDDGAPAATSYCFRVVDSSGGLLNTYTVIPEITTRPVAFEQSAYRWFENTQPETGFAYVLGDTGSDIGSSVIEDSSGNFIVAGHTDSYGAGLSDMLLVKFNSSGVEQWSKTWGNTGIDYANSVIEDSSGNFIVTGYTQSYGGADSDVALVKFNSSGVEQWSKTWGGTSSDVGQSVIEDSSGNFIVTGSTANYGAGSSDMLLVKFNSSGVEQWSKTWGGAAFESGQSVIEDSSGNFIVTGYTQSYGAGSNDMLLVKFNSSGVEQWSKTWGDTGADYGNSVIEDSSGNLIVTGSTTSYGAGSSDMLLSKFDSDGGISNCPQCADQTITESDQTVTESDETVTESDETVTESDETVTEADEDVTTMLLTGDTWATTIGGTGSGIGSDGAYGAAISGDGSIVTVGYTQNYGLGLNDALISKFNSSGVEQWSLSYGTTGNDFYNAVIEDSSGDYVATGYADASGVLNGNDLVLSKYDSSGTHLWSKRLGGTGHETGYGIVEDASGNYIVVGDTSSYVGADILLSKFNSSGVEQWSKTINSGGADYGGSVIVDSAGDIVITGTTSFGADDEIYIAKFNSSGVEQWSKTWDQTGNDQGKALIEDSSGDYVVLGSTNVGAGGMDYTLIKFNSSGVEQWSKTWGDTGTDTPSSLTEDSSGNYIVTGSTTFGGGTAAISLINFNSSGVEQWSKTWGGAGAERGYKVLEDGVGNLIVAGNIYGYGPSSTEQDLGLVKFNSSGLVANSSQLADETVSESDQTVTETNQTITETDRTLSETSFGTPVDENVQQIRVNGERGELLEVWGGTGEDYADSVIIDSSGDYIVTGDTRSYGGVDQDVFLGKFNSSGVEQWSKTWGGINNDSGNSVIEDSSGNYIVTATTGSYGAGGFDIALIKFNASGVEQWSKSWGNSGADYARSVIEDSSGNFIVTGVTNSYGAGELDMVLIKFNSSGVEQWSKTWGGTGIDYGLSVIEDSSGNFIVTGYTRSYGGTDDDIVLVKFNSSGVEQWSKTWGGDSEDQGVSVIEDSSGNFIVAGYSLSYGAGSSDAVFIKFNSSGIEQWSKTWGDGSYDYGDSVVEDADGNFFVSGATQIGAGLYAIALIKFNSSGVEQWSKTWGNINAGSAEGVSVVEDAEGNFIIAGYIYGFDGTDFDMALIKSRPDLESCGGICSIQDVTEADQTVTESDETVTEANQTVTEANQTVTEADETVTEVVINDVQYVEVPPMNVGAPRAGINTGTSTRVADSIIRLRSLLHVDGKPFVADSKEFKVQYATRVGTCDTSFVGESYSDLGTTGPVTFYSQGAGGSELVDNANDPVHSTHTVINQTYTDSGNLSAGYGVAVGEDTMFDFAVTNPAGSDGGSYCFRIVESTGTLLDTYTVIPEFTTPPGTNQLMRHGRYFDAGENAQVLFWSSLEW